MEHKDLSPYVLRRLPLYLAYLKSIPKDEQIYISATAIANALGLGEVQVRKDLAIVSHGGRPKVGYLREKLVKDFEQFLGYDYTDSAVLVGAGKLGQALLDYTGFEEYGLDIVAGFDLYPTAENTAGGKPILSMDKLPGFIQKHRISLGIITVPESCAQKVCDQLIECGIKAIWNFSKVRLEVPDHILVQNENLATSLAVLSMHMQALWKDHK